MLNGFTMMSESIA